MNEPKRPHFLCRVVLIKSDPLLNLKKVITEDT